MASEILSVPEERILEVVKVLRSGISTCQDSVSEDTLIHLMKWCNDMEEYMQQGDDDET